MPLVVYDIAGMSLRVTNVSSIIAQRHLWRNQAALQQSMTRLSTGKKINTASDDPAGLIAVTRLKSEIRLAEVEERSVRRANASANITDGQLAQLSDLMEDLQRLVIESANTGALSQGEIAANQAQIDHIVSSMQQFANDAVESMDRFNMPDGGNGQVAGLIQEALTQISTVTSGGQNDLNSGNQEAAEEVLDSATNSLSNARATIGAYQKYNLDPKLEMLQTRRVNLESSRSVIEDTDYAEEISNLIRSQILIEFGIKVLAIANNQAKSILTLLQN